MDIFGILDPKHCGNHSKVDDDAVVKKTRLIKSVLWFTRLSTGASVVEPEPDFSLEPVKMSWLRTVAVWLRGSDVAELWIFLLYNFSQIIKIVT